MIDTGVQHADVYNLLGYSLRKSGDTRPRMTYYQKALEFDPDHKGALEYPGELYVEIGDIAKAPTNVAKLTSCARTAARSSRTCEEAIDRVSAKSQ